MSIPEWAYDAAHYDQLLNNEIFEVITDPVKGKGLILKRAVKEGEVVLRERALVCSQNLDDINAKIPVCNFCLVSLETPQDIVQRQTGESETAASLPRISEFKPKHSIFPCRFASTGCIYVFCSKACENAAWESWMNVCCRGNMEKQPKKAFDQFLQAPWVVNGIDLTDTHAMAWRLVCIAISSSRRQSISIEQAYAPIHQLIRAPLSKFFFTYLLAEDWENKHNSINRDKETPEETEIRRWNHFCKHREDQNKDPITVASRQLLTPQQKLDYNLKMAVTLLDQMIGFTQAEREFFTEQRWSELLGAVLLNGQERSGNSPYVCEYLPWIRKQGDEAKKATKEFHARLRQNNHEPKDLDTSSRGQGIYAIGANFNHSCAPNIQVSYCDRNDETLVVTALRDLEKGEEICISYISEDDCYTKRQQYLQEHYLFQCLCAKCKTEAPAHRAKSNKNENGSP